MANTQLLRLLESKESSSYRRVIGEFWPREQRLMHSLHYAVSYRGSFRPQLPDFCIRRYSQPGDVVLDPFCGRGTTALQANLLGRIAVSSDISPLAVLLTRAKTAPIGLDEVVLALNQIDFNRPVDMAEFQERLFPFYHPHTYRELVCLRAQLRRKRDRVNAFLEMLAISRLHGHTAGYFSGYSSPHISLTPEKQQMLNLKRRVMPEHRAVAPRLIKRAAQVLRDGFTSHFFEVAGRNSAEVADARSLGWLRANSIDLVVTSPPFLDMLEHLPEQWLELWFSGSYPQQQQSRPLVCHDVDEWIAFMRQSLGEMLRVLKPQSYAVLDMGEAVTDAGPLFLDELIAAEAGRISHHGKRFRVQEILIHQQKFTDFSQSFASDQNRKLSNANRLVVLQVSEAGAARRPAKRSS